MNDATDSAERNRAAPCGLYCGACSAYIARQRDDRERLDAIAKRIGKVEGWVIKPDEDLGCEGCLSSKLAIMCRKCAIRDCAINKGYNYCARCPDFPCQTIINFNNDGRPHHSEVLDSIRQQQQMGIDSWLEEQGKRWQCPACGCSLEWYDTRCPQCSATMPRQF